MHESGHHPTTVDDPFFRQLAGGGLAEPEPQATPAPRQPSPPGQRPPQRNRTDPRAAHPIDDTDQDQTSRGTRRSHRRAAQPKPGPDPPRAHRVGRLAAPVSLAVAVVAVVALLLGGDKDEPGAKPRADRGAANGTPNPDKGKLAVQWQAPGTRADVMRARWKAGGDATVLGHLTTPVGEPVADARVSVLAADAARPDQGNYTVAQVRTDRAGRFHALIALDRGAPRKLLSFSYLARARDTVPAASGRVALRVSAPIAIEAPVGRIRPGETIRLGGRTAPGAQVQLLSRSPGARRWQALTTVPASTDGGWRTPLRIPRSARGRYQFRARVKPSRRGWLGADSRALELRVR